MIRKGVSLCELVFVIMKEGNSIRVEMKDVTRVEVFCIHVCDFLASRLYHGQTAANTLLT